VPAGVFLRKVDLSTELQILSFHEQRRAAVNLVRQTAAATDRSGSGQRQRSPEGPQGRG
jgi:redox-sensing transcriptional repressor